MSPSGFLIESAVPYEKYTCKNPHVKHMWFTCGIGTITCDSHVFHMWVFTCVSVHMWFTCEPHVKHMCIFHKGSADWENSNFEIYISTNLSFEREIQKIFALKEICMITVLLNSRRRSVRISFGLLKLNEFKLSFILHELKNNTTRDKGVYTITHNGATCNCYTHMLI